jgi:hypothetical protein
MEVPAEVAIHQIDDRIEIDLATIEPTVANVDENRVSHDDRVAGRPKKSKTTSMQPNFNSVDRLSSALTSLGALYFPPRGSNDTTAKPASSRAARAASASRTRARQ